MAARLKVFTAAIGFHETVVAAASRKAALAAWGVHRDLFADGEAAETQDAQAREAATAHPGVVLVRPVGSSAAFAPPEAQAAGAKPQRAGRAKPPPSRKALDAAEGALRAVDEEGAAELNDFAERRAALEAEEQSFRADLQSRREAAQAGLEKARADYRKAGGKA